MRALNRILDNFTKEEIFRIALDGHSPYFHQLETVENFANGKSVVLRAPCGSGKTEACYVSLLFGKNSFPGKLVYSLPTRALVEDVCERIKQGICKIGSPLSVSPQHGANSEDPFFKSNIIVATIDQTVGAYCCTPLSLPVHLGNIPAGAAVSSFLCFDEAHVYDHMLGLQSMLVLIERAVELELPFLVMSATLPDSFIEWFKNHEEISDKVAIVEGKDADVPKRLNRHVVLRWKSKLLESEDVLKNAFSWRRIMVVCNTVKRAQELYSLVRDYLKKYDFSVYLLHSRFLDQHRKLIEDQMKASLKNPDKKTCFITTQVCEVGLDISCDLLLTELAPPDALIQRIGRCAREGGSGEVWVFDVEHCAPYDNAEMKNSQKYISEILNGKRFGWNDELAFVNALLNDEFKLILNDKKRRDRILLSLGNAAFKGDRYGVESNIRELLSANLTIHDRPDKLGYHEILRMPWIDVDVRVLQRQLINAKFWQIRFDHDENGEPEFCSIPNAPVHPYNYYVVHPDYAAYDENFGLRLGERGTNLSPIITHAKIKHEFEYQRESWEEHARRCLVAFSNVKSRERHCLETLLRLLELNITQTEGLLALSIALHDLGKLNKSWQESIGVAMGDTPLAHIPYCKRTKIAHAAISADALYPLFRKLLSKRQHSIAFKLAIAHHHHTRAETVEPYTLSWANYEKIVEKICSEYSLDASPKDIRKTEEHQKRLETSMINLESTFPYTMYCIVSRFIRLSDQDSFSINGEKLKDGAG
ncbi:MAG: CRISPR-associated helicase Cas3' [Candidatus Bathyarchaeota archaeon]|nr:CRISPR-associated helicase Cas3' [Candidatus Bathyarchaeota archaeon]